MEICDKCSYWQAPRGFQQPSSFNATHARLLEFVASGTFEATGSHNFPCSEASDSAWPKRSVFSSFTCTGCGQKFTLFVDVDACRGGFEQAP